MIAEHPELDVKVTRQGGTGKGDAVRKGFDMATGDVLILDADLTVPPEDLTKFWSALVEERGEFINGTRLVYPMENNAMRLANTAANKVFSLIFTWILGERVTDTLCGTKVLWARDYRRIAANRKTFGDFDPFGDFDLLFGAANLGLKIREVPVRYRERKYGTTNIDRWRHGQRRSDGADRGAEAAVPMRSDPVGDHFDRVAPDYDRWKAKAHRYYAALKTSSRRSCHRGTVSWRSDARRVTSSRRSTLGRASVST